VDALLLDCGDPSTNASAYFAGFLPEHGTFDAPNSFFPDYVAVGATPAPGAVAGAAAIGGAGLAYLTKLEVSSIASRWRTPVAHPAGRARPERPGEGDPASAVSP